VLSVPSRADKTTPLPLVIALHGYGSNGAQLEAAWGFSALGEREGFLVAIPDGTPDARGSRFWNASDACCDFSPGKGGSVDDVAYLGALMDDVAARRPLDRQRVFVVGHSNGGFMAHRLACDLSGRVAAVVSMAGAAWKDAARCTPTSPVSVAQVHGTDDPVIAFAGGTVFDMPGRVYPSVNETMSLWKARLGCAGKVDVGAAHLDLDARIPGSETRVDRYAGCKAGLELWTIDHGSHAPAMTPTWAEAVWAFFKAHPKPAG
jgi:polyhydroxybutyrate depolymerase